MKQTCVALLSMAVFFLCSCESEKISPHVVEKSVEFT